MTLRYPLRLPSPDEWETALPAGLKEGGEAIIVMDSVTDGSVLQAATAVRHNSTSQSYPITERVPAEQFRRRADTSDKLACPCM